MQVPFFPQEAYQCGPAALATVLGWTGLEVTPEQLVDDVYLPARKGSLQIEMLVAPARHGRLAVQLPPREAGLRAELDAGHPVVVLQNLALPAQPVWHYAVLTGYDATAEEWVLNSGRVRGHRLGSNRFLATWERASHWAMVVLPAGELPASEVTAQAYIAGALALERAGRRDEAEKVFTAGLARWPDEALMPFGLANARYARGDLAGAEQALRIALQIDGGAMPVLNNLAQVLIERGCPALAIPYAERALALAGERSAAVEVTLKQAREKAAAGAVCRHEAAP